MKTLHVAVLGNTLSSLSLCQALSASKSVHTTLMTTEYGLGHNLRFIRFGSDSLLISPFPYSQHLSSLKTSKGILLKKRGPFKVKLPCHKAFQNNFLKTFNLTQTKTLPSIQSLFFSPLYNDPKEFRFPDPIVKALQIKEGPQLTLKKGIFLNEIQDLLSKTHNGPFDFVVNTLAQKGPDHFLHARMAIFKTPKQKRKTGNHLFVENKSGKMASVSFYSTETDEELLFYTLWGHLHESSFIIPPDQFLANTRRELCDLKLLKSSKILLSRTHFFPSVIPLKTPSPLPQNSKQTLFAGSLAQHIPMNHYEEWESGQQVAKKILAKIPKPLQQDSAL